MDIRYYLMIIFGVLILYTVLYKIAKKKKPLKRALITMISGVLVLLFVDALSYFTGVYLPISPLSLAVSACIGAPGVASMLIVSWIL